MPTSLKLYTIIMMLFISLPAQSAKKPQFWGVGVNTCQQFVETVKGYKNNVAVDVTDYLAYRSWLSGFVSGLSAATYSDVLQGIDIRSAMRRIHLHCQEQPKRDFANASMQLIRILNDKSNE